MTATLNKDYPDKIYCGICSKRSFYIKKDSDRLYHCDGSDNRHCWTAILRGDIHVSLIYRDKELTLPVDVSNETKLCIATCIPGGLSKVTYHRHW